MHTGTIKAYTGYMRLQKQIQEIMTTHDSMTPKDKNEADSLLKAHNEFKDKLKNAIQFLENENQSNCQLCSVMENSCCWEIGNFN